MIVTKESETPTDITLNVSMASEDEEPWSRTGFMRFGRVYTFSQDDAGRERLVHSLLADEARGWQGMPEVHLTRGDGSVLSSPRGGAAGPSSFWCVVDKPRAVRSGRGQLHTRRVVDQGDDPALYRELAVVPVREVRPRIAKFDVRLREHALFEQQRAKLKAAIASSMFD